MKQTKRLTKSKTKTSGQSKAMRSADAHDIYGAMSDLDVLQAVLAHESNAWDQLITRFRGLIFRCIYKALAKFESVVSSEAADEIFSEVCFNLLRNDMRKLRMYDPARGSKLGSFIGLISINSAYDYLRKCSRRPMLDQIDGCPDRVDTSPTPLETVLYEEKREQLRDITRGLSEKDRRFVDLYYHRGLSPQEIATRLEISIKTVYSKKNKIRRRLFELTQAWRLPTLATA